MRCVTNMRSRPSVRLGRRIGGAGSDSGSTGATNIGHTTLPMPRSGDEDGIVPPPSTMTVDDRAVILYTHDARPLVRRAGF